MLFCQFYNYIFLLFFLVHYLLFLIHLQKAENVYPVFFFFQLLFFLHPLFFHHVFTFYILSQRYVSELLYVYNSIKDNNCQ